MTRFKRACVAAMMCAGGVASGCGGPAGPDPKAEAQQKVEADAMMKQYETGSKAPGDAQPGSK
ncbi:MAG: hypothetical protein ACKO35_05070 [Planctomycetaceae bacterium]